MIVYIVEMKTLSTIPLLTANFQKLSREVIHWFNNVNYTNQRLSVKETLFHLFPTSSIENKTLLRKLNYTMLYMRYYIYTSKLHNRSITLSDFVSKLNTKYSVENVD